jgi:hypothetical protein
VSPSILTIVEEASHSLGQHLTVVGVRDEAVSGATDTFAVAQEAGREAAENLDNNMVYEASHCVPLVGVSSISSVCSRMRASLVMRSLKRKIIQQSPSLKSTTHTKM